MTLNQMVYFRKLAETSHMGQAAEQLFISQPSLSISITKLEEELGCVLFARKGHKMSLTEEGEAFLMHVKVILQEIEEAKQHMKRLSELQNIRVGCITPAMTVYLPQQIHSFRALEENASVSFELSIANTEELIRRLKNGITDLLICSGNDDPELIQIPVISENICIISAEEDFQRPASWEELAELPLVGYDEFSIMDHFIGEIAARHNVRLHYEFRAPTENDIAALVENHLGCAVIPWSEQLMKKYKLHRYEMPDGPYRRDIFLTTLKDRNASGAAVRFIQFLKQQAG